MGTYPPGHGRPPLVLGGRYALHSRLGRGGMGEVHLAQDLRLDRRVAVKILRAELLPDYIAQTRFRREAQSAASLNHPSVVAVYDTGEDRWGEAPLPYIVMEYVEGMTLSDLLGAGPPPTAAEAMAHVAGVLEALEYSHAAGIVHRDIKPANVMVTRGGAVKVMDFGISRFMHREGATMTAPSVVLGTAAYLSPEQARGTSADARSDLYATGCVLYELLTGGPPFTAESPLTVLYQHVEQPPVPPGVLIPGLDPAVDAVVLRALAKDPADRFQSAGEMRAALDAAAFGGSAFGRSAIGEGVLGDGVPGEDDGALLAGARTTEDPPDAWADAAEAAAADDPAAPGRPRWLVAAGAVVVATGLIMAGTAMLNGTASSGAAQASGTSAAPAASGAASATSGAPSGGPETLQVVVPDVEGDNLAVARTRLLAVGLVAAASSDGLQARVTGQSPATGTRVRPGSVITLSLAGSTGPAPAPSDLKGLAEAIDPALDVPGSGATATSGSGSASGDGGSGQTSAPPESSSPSASPSATPTASASQAPATLPPGGPPPGGGLG